MAWNCLCFSVLMAVFSDLIFKAIPVENMLPSLPWSLSEIINGITEVCRKMSRCCMLHFANGEVRFIGHNCIGSQNIFHCNFNDIITQLYIQVRGRTLVSENDFERNHPLPPVLNSIPSNSNSLYSLTYDNVMNTGSINGGNNSLTLNTGLTAAANPSVPTSRVANHFTTPIIGLNALNFLPDEIRQIPRVADKTKSILFKTKLCTRFMSGVLCFRGNSCSFAHGFGELREVSQHPSYRKKYCIYILNGLHCPFGGKCFFIHQY